MIEMDLCEFCNLMVPREQVCRSEPDLEECPRAPGEDDE